MKSENASPRALLFAALAGLLVTAGVAAAQDADDAYDESGLYDYYDAGYDSANDDDHWFYDYYELDDDYLTTGYEHGYDYDYDFDAGVESGWFDGDDAGGSDDAGDEGVFDW